MIKHLYDRWIKIPWSMITMQYYALLNCTCDACDQKNFKHFDKLFHTQSKKNIVTECSKQFRTITKKSWWVVSNSRGCRLWSLNCPAWVTIVNRISLPFIDRCSPQPNEQVKKIGDQTNSFVGRRLGTKPRAKTVNMMLYQIVPILYQIVVPVRSFGLLQLVGNHVSCYYIVYNCNDVAKK